MICKNCKTTIPDDSIVCPLCGQKVEAKPLDRPIISTAFHRAGSLDGSDSGMSAPVVEKKPPPPQEDTGLRISPNLKRGGNKPAEIPEPVPVIPKEEEGPVIDVPSGGGSWGRDDRHNNDDSRDTEEEQPEQKRTSFLSSKAAKKAIIAVGAIAAVLALVVFVGSVTNWFGFYGPAAQIASATQKTLRAVPLGYTPVGR